MLVCLLTLFFRLKAAEGGARRRGGRGRRKEEEEAEEAAPCCVCTPTTTTTIIPTAHVPHHHHHVMQQLIIRSSSSWLLTTCYYFEPALGIIIIQEHCFQGECVVRLFIESIPCGSLIYFCVFSSGGCLLNLKLHHSAFSYSYSHIITGFFVKVYRAIF